VEIVVKADALRAARVFLAFLGLGCGGTEPKTPVLTSITVTFASPSIAAGSTVLAAVSGLDQNGTAIAVSGVTWSSNNEGIATVSDGGVVTGVSVGSAQITATSGTVQGAATINVSPVPVSTIEVSGTTSEVVGGTLAVNAVLKAADGTVLERRTITWSVSDASRASVTQAGTVTILSPGSVNVIATSEGRTGSVALTGLPFSFTTISAGFGGHTCGVTPAGSLFCWGENVNGKLGDGTTTDRTKPTQVATTIRFSKVFAGVGITCALTANGAAYCWGPNGIGQLGTGTSTSAQLMPIPAISSLAFESMSIAHTRTCGLTTARAIVCWAEGPFGDGSPAAISLTPVSPQGGQTFKVVATAKNHTCGLTTAGAAYCWGSNDQNQLGDGTNTSPRLTPVPVTGGLAFVSIVAGVDFNCGLTATGAAWCWGWNLEKQLGDGTQNFSAVPVAVQGGLSFASLTAGFAHVCGLTSSGEAYCWGQGSAGQIGDVTTGGLRGAPAAVSGGLTFNMISGGGQHTCGVTTTGAGYCWGTNTKGALGDGTTTRRDLPGPIVPP
jgi:alpha-tubulin suppressor-like RCC1 family protein